MNRPTASPVPAASSVAVTSWSPFSARGVGCVPRDDVLNHLDAGPALAVAIDLFASDHRKGAPGGRRQGYDGPW